MADAGLTLGTIAIGLGSGFVGWLATEFVAKPFRRGVDLIFDARTKSVVFANVAARAKLAKVDAQAMRNDISEAEEERLKLAETEYRSIGASMKAFAMTERLSAVPLKLLGFDFIEIGTAFIGLSNSVGVYGQERNDATKRMEKALKLKT